MPEWKENYVISDFSLESGYEQMGKLLEKCPDVDTVICATDTIAVGAMQYLQEKGIRIPEQVLLAGHGDSTISNVTTPALTSIRFSYEENGVRSARLLLEHLEDEAAAVRGIMMGYCLVEKGSTRRSRN